MPRSKKTNELHRYSLIGFTATVIDYGSLNLFSQVFGWPLIGANILSATTSSSYSYVMNKKVVFKDKAHSERKTILLYAGTLIVGVLVIQSGILFLLGRGVTEGIIEAVGIDGSWDGILADNLAKVIAGFGTFVWNFFTQRRYVFKSHDNAHN